MALNLRQRQTSCIVRMLNLNQPPNRTTGSDGGGSAGDEVYKILILDPFCRDVLSPLIHVKDLRKHGVTLYFPIDKERHPVPDVPAVYFVRPTPSNLSRVASDAAKHLYDSLHLNLSSSLPRPLLEDFASSVVKSDSLHRIAKIYDQYLEFITLEDNLFSLAQPDVYLRVNDPAAGDREIEEIVDRVVNGLFCVLVTLSVVPVIRCDQGGPSEMVAAALDAKIRDHLIVKNNLFNEGGSAGFQRPLLCIFDRNFELSVGVQHDWAYRPLVHDVLGLRLNKVSVKDPAGAKLSYELDGSDPFWVTNAAMPFPKVAEEVDSQVKKYKADVDEVNRRTGGGFDDQDLAGNTKHLMSAVNSLPELTERRKLADRHTNIATALLTEIKERSLDSYYDLENDMLTKGSVDRATLISSLKGKGSKVDKLRLAIVYLLSMEVTPQPEMEAVEVALRESEVDVSAFLYVKKIKSLNASLAANSANSASRSNIVDWAEKLYGQSISAVTAGMKNLLAGGRQLAVTRTVEALMEGRPNPEVDHYLTFDPRASRSGSGGSGLMGPFKEAIVFMIGGGNYVEYGSLREMGQRSQPAKHVVYGTTELLTGTEFVEQLGVLGKKMGLGVSSGGGGVAAS
ncbi:SEC1 family transport protein SLY1 [Acorus calamus]|uniref:SEC1 family transport protein SLY1 n=1 Tax=Acorus calamus TaxID=4465 RepID=A0AAV9DBL2_ACOCL|nr:SEC1 family transport protein SLY1 [Acorus calamus]